MSEPGKKCPKLRKDKDGQWYCSSTHICFKYVCYKTLFETITHTNGGLVVNSNEK